MTARVAGADDGLIEAIRAHTDKGKESISRDAMQDGRLSMKARGILGYLLSKPDRWRTSAKAIAGECEKDGREAIANGLAELEAAGYLARKRRNGGGGRWAWSWIYSDEPAKVRAVLEAMEPDGAGLIPDARRGRARPANVQVEPINGFAADGSENPQVDTMNGFAAHGETGDGFAARGKPVHIEKQEQEITPPTPRERGEPEAPDEQEPPAPAGGPSRCQTHNRAGCRECGLSPRVQARAERDAAAAAIAEHERVGRACTMCIPDGTGRDGGTRWIRALPGLQAPVTPYDVCDHATPHRVRMAELNAADEARVAEGVLPPDEPASAPDNAARTEIRAFLAARRPPTATQQRRIRRTPRPAFDETPVSQEASA